MKTSAEVKIEILYAVFEPWRSAAKRRRLSTTA
jgi:hypothetical protein